MIHAGVRKLAYGLLCPLLCFSAQSHALNYRVTVGGPNGEMTFDPLTLTIVAGDTITWFNAGGTHNVYADNGSFRCAHGCDGDGMGGNGAPNPTNWIVTVPMNTPGTIGYYCQAHGSPGSGMYGVIVVNDLIFADGFNAP